MMNYVQAQRLIGRYMDGKKVDLSLLAEAAGVSGTTMEVLRESRVAAVSVTPVSTTDAMVRRSVRLFGRRIVHATGNAVADRARDVHSFVTHPSRRQLTEFCRDTGMPMDELVRVC